MLGGELKDGAGIQDEQSECLSASQGRETIFSFMKISTPDQVPLLAQKEKSLGIGFFYLNIIDIENLFDA
ncbi:MAG: hypothetical protein ACJAV6_000649 [Candidatus Paceibacteria bacterium]|jgi:hypothetical protein